MHIKLALPHNSEIIVIVNLCPKRSVIHNCQVELLNNFINTLWQTFLLRALHVLTKTRLSWVFDFYKDTDG